MVLDISNAECVAYDGCKYYNNVNGYVHGVYVRQGRLRRLRQVGSPIHPTYLVCFQKKKKLFSYS